MAINKVEFGNRVLIDLTDDTVTPDTLLNGEIAHDSSGNIIYGNFPNLEDDILSFNDNIQDSYGNDIYGSTGSIESTIVYLKV